MQRRPRSTLAEYFLRHGPLRALLIRDAMTKIPRRRIDVDALLDQPLHHMHMAVSGSKMKWRPPTCRRIKGVNAELFEAGQQFDRRLNGANAAEIGAKGRGSLQHRKLAIGCSCSRDLGKISLNGVAEQFSLQDAAKPTVDTAESGDAWARVEMLSDLEPDFVRETLN